MSSLERKILDTLGTPGYHPINAAELAKHLEITKKRRAEFREALDALLESDQVRQDSSGLLRGHASAALMQGVIKKTTGGFGFLIPHSKKLNSSQQDIYIGRQDMGDAHTGDEVLVKLLNQSPRADGKLRGKIVDIIQRSTRTFVGVYLERDEQGWVQVDGTTLNEPIFVGDPGAKGSPEPGDKVVLEMLRFPSTFRGGEGVITRVLGPRGSVGIDTLSIIHEFGLPDEFPEDFLEEARIQAERFDESHLGGRLDLTERTIVTIDPVDARDFDDAISLEQTENGHWLLGVHIADVAHFVQPGSALDKEAYRRGTSVYLPDRVLPMLPEIISNGLASLQQGHVRYTKSVFMEFSREGIPVNAEFANSAIKVTRRFAYEEVMPIVEHPEKFRNKVPGKIRKLSRMYELAMLLRGRRFAQGMLELTMPEVKIDFNKEGKVSGAHVAAHDPSHQVIEEFMLAANMAVATALNDKGVPFLRRVHGEPDEKKMKALGEFVTALGYPLKHFQSRPELQKLLARVKDTPHMHAVNYALLRSMKQAEYTGEPLGHYALAAEHYCHFTSPIRRYPDLTVHRLIGELVAEGKVARYPGELELVTSGQHCSATERRAAQAERELIKVKLLTYMAGRIGEEFEAIITGVQDFGFFCQVIDIPAEGLVHMSTLDDDHYDFDAASQTLVGRQSGRQHRLGDRLKIVAADVDVDRRQLDFRVAGSHSASRIRKPTDAAGQAAAPPPSSGKRRHRGLNDDAKKRDDWTTKSRPKKKRR